jgi:hypothetical protein
LRRRNVFPVRYGQTYRSKVLVPDGMSIIEVKIVWLQVTGAMSLASIMWHHCRIVRVWIYDLISMFYDGIINAFHCYWHFFVWRFSTAVVFHLFVCLPPDVISLQLYTPLVVVYGSLVANPRSGPGYSPVANPRSGPGYSPFITIYIYIYIYIYIFFFLQFYCPRKMFSRTTSCLRFSPRGNADPRLNTTALHWYCLSLCSKWKHRTGRAKLEPN